MSQPKILTGELILPNNRRWRAGRQLDGRTWLEIEGLPRLLMTRAQTLDIIRGLCTCIDIQLERVPTLEELS